MKMPPGTKPQSRPTTPARKHAGLGSSPFARRYSGSRSLFPLLWVLRCFSSPGSPRHLNGGDWCSHQPGSPIRTSRDQRSLPAPPGFSQVATSFIGSGAEASTVCPYYLDLPTPRSDVSPSRYSLHALGPLVMVPRHLSGAKAKVSHGKKRVKPSWDGFRPLLDTTFGLR